MTTHVSSSIELQTLSCGLTLLVEPNSSVSSCAITWLLPVGSAHEVDATDGRAALLSELIFRGAGSLNSREHSDALDRLGVQRSSRVGGLHMRLGATLLADRLDEALPLLTMMITNPALPDEALDPVRNLCLQTLDGLSDDPQDLVSLRLREVHMPPPYNRHGYGQRQALEQTRMPDLRDHWKTHCTPAASIFSIAGAVDPAQVSDRLEQLLEGWSGDDIPAPDPGIAARTPAHLEQDSAQVHIALACEAPKATHEDAILERIAISVLSGGSSGRLFTEVRQKRSLCYSVGASYGPARDWGVVSLYAGTTPQRAQETLDVSLEQFASLRGGASQEEFDRAIIGAKSAIVMNGESTSARAGALAGDQFALGRPRSLEERIAELEAVTLDELNAYLAKRQFGPFTISTIGPEALTLPAK